MRRNRSTLCLVAVLCLIVWASGCAKPRPAPSHSTGEAQPVPHMEVGTRLAARTQQQQQQADSRDKSNDVAPITNTDACASHLHQICGPLLLYYHLNHHLPENLDELRAVPGFD